MAGRYYRKGGFLSEEFLNNLSRPVPKKTKIPAAVEQIDRMIRTIRGMRVMLDRDLAKIYGVPTFRFNEAIKRNRHRFPTDFMFQLTRAEFDKTRCAVCKLIANCDEFRQACRFDIANCDIKTRSRRASDASLRFY
jgi:hypothetical protein